LKVKILDRVTLIPVKREIIASFMWKKKN